MAEQSPQEALQEAYAMAEQAKYHGPDAYLRVSPTRWDWLCTLDPIPGHRAGPSVVGLLVGSVKVEEDRTLTGMDWEVVLPPTMEPAPDRTWVRTVCICCGREHHTSLLRRTMERIRGASNDGR